jgi:Ca2+/Na+ antiporter
MTTLLSSLFLISLFLAAVHGYMSAIDMHDEIVIVPLGGGFLLGRIGCNKIYIMMLLTFFVFYISADSTISILLAPFALLATMLFTRFLAYYLLREEESMDDEES